MDWFLGNIPPGVVKDVFFTKVGPWRVYNLKETKNASLKKHPRRVYLVRGFISSTIFKKGVPRAFRQVKRAEQRVRSGTPLGRRQRSLSAGRRKESPFDKMTVEEMCHFWGVDE